MFSQPRFLTCGLPEGVALHKKKKKASSVNHTKFKRTGKKPIHDQTCRFKQPLNNRFKVVPTSRVTSWNGRLLVRTSCLSSALCNTEYGMKLTCQRMLCFFFFFLFVCVLWWLLWSLRGRKKTGYDTTWVEERAMQAVCLLGDLPRKAFACAGGSCWCLPLCLLGCLFALDPGCWLIPATKVLWTGSQRGAAGWRA